MKKKLLLLLFLVVGFITNSALATDVKTFTELQSGVAVKDAELNLQNNITTSEEIAASTNLTIFGNHFILNGANNYRGFTSSGNFTINDIILSNFNIDGDGGAINHSSGNLNIYNSIFSKNAVTFNGSGGAINNSLGTVNIYNSEFTSNSAVNGFGGAIFNSENLNVYNSLFSKNTSVKDGVGGAIFNDDASALNVYNSEFIDNNTSRYGGAINNKGTAVIRNSTFTNNITGGSTNTDSYGGAINNAGTAIIFNSRFIGNKITAGTGKAGYGGAISNIDGPALNIYNSTFTGNTATTNGGAIYNSNVAKALNIISDAGKIEFTGNTAGGVSNAIHNEKTANFNSKAGAGEIVVNDAITGTNGVININQAAGTGGVPTGTPNNGVVYFNNKVSGNDLNINNGMLSLGSFAAKGAIPASTGSFMDNTKGITMNGTSIINLANGAVSEAITAKTFTVASGANSSIWLDVNLTATDLIDTITATTYANNGTLNLKTFRMLSDSATPKTIEVLKGGTSPNFAVSDTYTNNFKYAVTKAADGKLTFTQNTTMVDGLSESIKASDERSFSLIGDYIANKNLAGDAISGTLTVFGDGPKTVSHSISGGNTYSLFNVNNGATLNVVDATIKDFANTAGGAILNKGNTTLYNSSFANNKATTDEGGAISNSGSSANLSVYNSTFTNNTTTTNGGAIATSGTSNIYNSTFTGNQAEKGGAIFNTETTSIYNSSFTNNKATAGDGGAISNGSIVNLIANGVDIQFTGNTANGVSNAINNNSSSSILNLNAGSNIANAGMIVFNDKITGQGTINVNNSVANSGIPTNGTVLLNEDMKDYTGAVNLHNGTLKLGSNGIFFNNASVFTANGGTLDFANKIIQSQNLGNLTLGGNLGMKVDADLAKLSMDTIKATSVNAGSSQINVDYINLLSDASSDGNTSINFADSNLKGNVAYTGNNSVAYTPTYQYTVNYDEKDGNFNFLRGTGGIGGNGNISDVFNPAVLAGPVAAQLGSYLTQLNSYNQAFMNMDMYMLMTNEQRQALKMRNKYAAADSNLIYNPLMTKYDNKAGWFRAYSSFENVPLKNGPKVSNVAYGSLFGADSEIYDLGHGFDGIFSVYAGYNGSHQAYNGVGVFQNGGMLGVTGVAYKENFFTGLTINAGANAGEASTMFGQENFTMLTAGIASKTGYNWELLKGKMIIQPSFLMSYSFVNTFNYRNAAGLNIQSSPLNAIQIEPGIKFIGNLKNGWQPYLGVSMVWNIMDKTIFKANDVSLPEMSVKPYVRYGVGLQKLWGERFTGFAQAFITNGGRNGVGLQAGFRWSF